MPQPQKIQQNGYGLIVDGRVIRGLRSSQGGVVAGMLHTFNAPKGFVPGPNENKEKGYSTGSEIITQDERVFKCVNGQEGKWVLLHAGTSSFVDNKKEKTVEVHSDKKTDTVNLPVMDSEEKPESKKAKPSQAKAESKETPLPEDVPYYGYITDKNDIHTLQELKKVASKKKGLESLNYFNKDRAKKVSAWIEKNG